MRAVRLSACLLSGFAAWGLLGTSIETGPRFLASSPADAQEGRPMPDLAAEGAAMFRRLDANGDGKLTKSEARPQEKGLFDNIFQMAGKKDSDSLSPSDFQQVFERHRRGQTGRPAGGAAGGAPGGAPGNRPSEEGRPGAGRPPSAGPGNERPNGSRPSAGRPNETPSQGSRSGSNGNATRPEPNGRNRPEERAGREERTGRNGATGGAATGASRIAGVWRGWVVDGRGENPNSGHMQMELTIEGNRMTAREVGNRGGGGEGLGDGTFVVSAQGNTGNLDATGTSGRHDGVEYLGIFEVDGDTLKWCVGNRGRPRPREFSTGRQNYYMLLRRQTR